MNYREACEWLGLDARNSIDESTLKSSFRRAAIKEHPDKSSHDNATERFQNVKRAHEFLDECLERGETGPNANYNRTDEDAHSHSFHRQPEDDGLEEFLARMFFTRMMFGGQNHVHVRMGTSFTFGGGPSFYYEEEDDDYYDDDEDDYSSDLEEDDDYVRYLKKQQAPLLDEWVEVINLKSQTNSHLNGQKAKAIDYSDDGRYTIQVDRRLPQSNFLIKPENLRKWGSKNYYAAPAANEPEGPSKSKSRRQRRKEARKRHQQEQEFDAENDTNTPAPSKDEESRDVEDEEEVVDASQQHTAKEEGIKKKSCRQRKKEAKMRQQEKQTAQQAHAEDRQQWDEKEAVAEEQESKGKEASTEESAVLTTQEKEEHNNTTTVQTTNEGNDVPTFGSDFTYEEKKTEDESKTKPAFNQNTSSIDKTMEQFERLSKELEDKVDLSNIQQPANTTPTASTLPKYIQHKVRCPKDKKPGDIIEFTNPHIPGQKRNIYIPKDAKPGKFFKVMVPLPTKTKKALALCTCCKIQVSEDDKEEDATISKGVTLRSCVHLCCQECFPTIEGKMCPTCNSPLPTIGSLDPLPYIEQFDSPSDAVKNALIEEFYVKKEADRISTKEKETELEEASNAATKAVDKHYRRASLKVHPDRFGETYRKEFDALTKARDVLRNTEMRRKYLSELLDIVCRVDVGYVPRSHHIWVERNDPDAENTNTKPKSVPGKGPELPFQLDGGIAFDRPKRPVISLIKGKRIKIYLPLKDEHQFLVYCQKVTIVGSCGNMDENEVVLAEIKKSKFDMFDASLRYELTIPENGIWDVSWFATLDIAGIVSRTPHSSEKRVDLRTDGQRALVHRKVAMETLARRWTNEIQSKVRNQRPSGATDRKKVEDNFACLHPVISKGRDISKKLQHLLKNVGQSSSPALMSLVDALKQATKIQAQLEKNIDTYGQRDARRAFRQTIAKKLEQGDGEAWVAAISREDLVTLGGDANRLYQLLIEGKKASSLSFNDSTLEAAESRTDLFTPKQCETIKKKKLEVQALLAADLEHAVQEAKKREEEGKNIKRMEAKANRVQIPRGAAVKIQGLKTRPELNGTMGIYMGLAHGDRYTVRLDSDGKDIALKASNFKKWDFVKDSMVYSDQPKSVWACTVCTFVHEGMLASADRCTVCDSPRDVIMSVGKENVETKHSTKNGKAPGGRSQSKESRQEVAAAKQEQNSTSSSLYPSTNTSVEKKAPVEVQNQAKWPSSNDQKNTPKAPTYFFSNNSGLSLGLQTGVSSTLQGGALGLDGPCMLGLNCPHLQQGPDMCTFYHAPEEIAYYHSNHPGAIALSVLPTEPLLQRSYKQVEQAEPEQKPVVQQSYKQVEQAEPEQKPTEVKSELAKPKNSKRCSYGLKCTNLKRGAGKCKFFHPPDEIALHHPDFESGETTPIKGTTTPKATKKGIRPCKYGVDCRKLKKSPTLCPFFHSPEDIVVHHPKEGPEATNRMKDMERNILVDATVTPHIVGKYKKHIIKIMKISGAKVSLTREVDSNGMCTVRITGSEESVNTAANMVIEASLRPAQYFDQLEDSSTMSNLTGDEPSVLTKPAASMSSDGSGSSKLKEFLHKNKSCLKCSPDKFYQWLVSEDIETFEALVEGCADKEYHSVLQANGLKGFKRGPFLKAVKVASR